VTSASALDPDAIDEHVYTPVTLGSGVDGRADAGHRLAVHRHLGRIADLGDVVGPALFLAAPTSGFVTGQTLLVDGGYGQSVAAHVAPVMHRRHSPVSFSLFP
jgi:NAD(P)-dependent dehydrogenase (short-subunit alcohol dehydrogenase family)